MTKFTLQQKSAGPALTVFNVLDGKGGVIGSVNVANEEVPTFVKCWHGAYTPARKPTGPAAMAKILMQKRVKVPKAALLRS